MLDLEYLELKKQSVTTSQHKIISKHNPKKRQLFAIFEGKEDRAYYTPRIKALINDYYYDEIVEVIGFSKNNVIALNKRLNWEQYDSRQFVFFIDKDLDFWLKRNIPESSNIFVTDSYSVENYCVTNRVFKEFMLNIKGFSVVDDSELNRIMNLFDDWKQSFELAMRKSMGIACVAKSNNSAITLSNVKFTKGVYEISYRDGTITNKIHYNKIRKIVGVDSPEFDQLIDEQTKAIDENPNEYSVHGKWLLTAMGRLAELFRTNAMEFAPSQKMEILKPTSQVNDTQLFPIVAQYDIFSIPESLSNIIYYNYIQYLMAG